MKTNQYKVNITTTNQNNMPLSNLKVQVRDKADNEQTPLAVSTTDESGQCILLISSEDASTSKPNVRIVVIKEDQIIFRLDSVNFGDESQEANLKLQIHQEDLIRTKAAPIHPVFQRKNKIDLFIKVQDIAEQIFPNQTIEAWYHHPNQPDQLLGTGISDEKGLAKISFDWEYGRGANRSDVPVLYCKVLQEGKEAYNTMNDTELWWMINFEMHLLVKVQFAKPSEKETFNLLIEAKDEKNKGLKNHDIQAWYYYPDREDVLLGTASTNSNGQCTISFDWDKSVKQRKDLVVYCKIINNGKEVYDSTQDNKRWWLVMNDVHILLQLQATDTTEYPIPGIPILPNQFNTSLEDISNLTGQQQKYINDQLNKFLKDRLLGTLGIGNEKVRAVVDTLPITMEAYKDTPISILINEILIPTLKANPDTAPLLDNLPLDGIGRDGTLVKDLLQLRTPMKKHPAFFQSIKKIKTHVLVDIATNDKNIATLLSNQNTRWEDAPESEWQKLIEAGTISETQKTDLQHTFDLGKMTGDNLSLVKNIKGDKRVKTIKDLVVWEKEDWANILAQSNDETPNDEDKEEYVQNVIKVVERTYPTDFFMTRATKKNVVPVSTNFQDIAPLLKINENIFSAKKINWGEATAEQRKAIEPKIDALRKVANTYQHLGIKEIFSNGKTPKQKENALNKVVKSLDDFYKRNPDMDLMKTNFIKKPNNVDTKLNWEGIPEEMQPKIQRQMLAFQRVRSIAPDYDSSSKLMENNYDSAYRIAYKGRRAFTAETKIPEAQARVIYANAQKRAAQAVQQYHSIVELHHNQQLGLTVDNTITHAPTGFVIQPQEQGHLDAPAPVIDYSLYDQVRNELKDIDGFEELFGPQNFCQCDHCKSIFSPAAYFVDMMHFVEQHITEYSRSGIDIHGYVDPDVDSIVLNYPKNYNLNHPLWLHNRCPHLWDIELTCDCTYEMVPYLQIINEVKETYIKKLWEIDTAAGVPVNQSDDIYESLEKKHQNYIHFHSGKSEPLHEIIIQLEHYNISLLDINEATQQNIIRRTEAFMEIDESVLRFSKNPFRLFGSPVPFDNLEVRDFLKHAKITRRELDDVLASNFVKSKGNIKIVKSDFDKGIQYWHEVMIDIDKKGLAYLHYFIRIWKQLPYTIKELDLILDTISLQAGVNNSADPHRMSHITALYRIAKFNKHLNFSPEEIVALLDKIPNKSLKTIERKDPQTQVLYQENVPGYLSRHFDLEKIFGDDITVSINSELDADEEKFAYFLAGLKITNDDFIEIMKWNHPLFTPTINLNRNTLSTLSRYFRNINLAKKLKISLSDWNQLMLLKPVDLTDISELLELVEWVVAQKNNPFTFEELRFILSPPDDLITKEEIVEGLHHLEYPIFDKTIFLAIDEIVFNETIVKQLLNHLKTDELITESEDGNFQLTNKMDWNELEISINNLSVIDWATYGEPLKLALTPYHYFKNLSGIFLSQEELSFQGEINQEDILFLLERFTIANVLTITPDKKHFLVTDSYDLNILEGIISDLVNEIDGLTEPEKSESSLPATLLSFVNSKTAIDELLQDGKYKKFQQYTLLWEEFTGFTSSKVKATIPFMSKDWQVDFGSFFGNANDSSYPIPSEIFGFIKEIKFYELLFGKLNFEAISLNFISQNASNIFDIDNIKFFDIDINNMVLKLEDIEKFVKYKEWVDLDKTVVEELLHPMLLEIKTSRESTTKAFLHYFDLPENITNQAFYTNSLDPIPFANYVKVRAELCHKIGIPNGQLQITVDSSYGKKRAIANNLKATLQGKYEKEEDFKKAFEPYEEKINELKRDMLCEYIMGRSEINFKDTNEMYAFFLIDPEMSGCMKISKIVAAHLTLQLYIHRTLMNLEQSNDGLFKVFLEPEVLQEWEWRKNYRVWEANRLVGVYPERYIEPEMRDNKSPEFKQLEEELLQEKITLDSAEKAYIQYMKKFTILGKLVLAGSSYHTGTPKFPYPTYHLFGRTSTAPYEYYYRQLNIIEDTKNKTEKKNYTPWIKMELPISAPLVTSIVFRNKIFVFWLDIVHNKVTEVNNGNLKALKSDAKITLNYSYLQEDGKWLQPQRIDYLTDSDDILFQSQTLRELSDYQKSRLYKLGKPLIRDNQLYIYYDYVAHPNSLIVDFSQSIVDARQRKSRAYKIDFFRNKAIQLWGAEIYGENATITAPNVPNPSLSKDNDNVQLVRFNTTSIFRDKIGIIDSSSYYYKTLLSTSISFSKTSPDIYQVNPNLVYDNNNQLDLSKVRMGDSIITVNRDSFLYRRLTHSFINKRTTIFNGQMFSSRVAAEIEKMNSSMGEKFQDILMNQGLESLLSLETQKLTEPLFPFPIWDQRQLQNEERFESKYPGKLYFKGAYGNYYREIFFHIPFLIADHLNAEGKFKDANEWYQKIFNPTAEKDIYANKPVDRVWRFLEFRDQEFPKYSTLLTDGAFIEIYKKDPFNPHAIARIRTSAYQKTIVRKYIDNLLDWGDSLFRKFQFETINEAMMLYVLVQDILGERPQELCKCETAADDKLTYKDISQKLDDGNDFLIWVENQQQVITQIGNTYLPPSTSSPSTGNSDGSGASNLELGATTNNTNALRLTDSVTTPSSDYSPRKITPSYDDEVTNDQMEVNVLEDGNGYSYITRDGRLMYVQNITTEKPVFCVPMDKEFLELWDRVEDRLFKIRHCMNIDGVKQKLSLFAPFIDPRLLVAARASGLSIADAIASLDAPVPHYRFNYILDKAKSFTGTVQSFGGALLSALEKKDGEELTLIRSVHEQNILKMTTEIKTQQIEENKVQIKNLEETRKNIETRVDYYSELIETGLIKWEKTQQKAAQKAAKYEKAVNIQQILGSFLFLLPQIGAPTAMKYGGVELGSNAQAFSLALKSLAAIQRNKASNAASEAGNQRREEEWKNQLKLAEQELVAFEQQILSAQIRLSIAEKDLEIHKNQIEQAKELYDFYKGKFTNLGLYKYMATTMNRLFSQAYNLAFDMAKKAEKCYQFETNNVSFFIENDNWDSGHAGLLAGERLTLQLQRMEKAFIEKTPRREEVTQSFSLRMLSPEQLVNLQVNGECNFTIPEWAFNIFYPGHYRRTIKSVRLTIPCVAGPYTNISCRLNLTQNRIRTKPISGFENLFAGPNFANGTITTSTANNDGGQFELNFQDARYLPFEGGGAAGSEWTLSLPSAFRPFDYGSISDAIIHISYSALYDSTLKSKVEEEIKSTTGDLIGQDLFRLVSMKEEFPDALYQLQRDEADVEISISKSHFPFLFSNSNYLLTPNTSVGIWNGDNFITVLTPLVPDDIEVNKWNITIPFINYNEEQGDILLLVTYTISE